MRIAPLLIAIAALAACSPGEPKIRASEASVTVGTGMSAAYFILDNDGAGDVLTSVEAVGVGPATLHQSSEENGIARMRPIDGGIAIGKGETVALQPGGKHVMIMGTVAAGQKVALTLHFKRHADIHLTATAPTKAMAPGVMH